MRRNINGGNSSRRQRRSRALALLSIAALALAASPGALAHDRGGPGAPGVQQQIVTAIVGASKVSQRLGSRSD